MRNYRAFSLLVLLCWLGSHAFGQVIKGEVLDKITRTPIAGASITIAGGQKGVSTDASGKFSLEVNGAGSIRVSSVGYESLTVPLTNAGFYQVQLENINRTLDQVVVVGYGTQKKADLTGAVA